MTSNLGSHLFQEKLHEFNEDNYDEILGELRLKLSDLLRKTIRPEFLNRIDEVVLFKPLLKSELKNIIDIQLQKVGKLLQEKNITLVIKNEVKDFLLSIGSDITYGARPLKRTIQRHLINPLSTEILMNKFVSGDTVIVSYSGDGKINFIKE